MLVAIESRGENDIGMYRWMRVSVRRQWLFMRDKDEDLRYGMSVRVYARPWM